VTIYVSPSSLISAVLFSGSLVKQDGHDATLASSSLTSATSTSRASHRAIQSYDSLGFSQHGAHCYITNFRPRPRSFVLPVIHVYTKRCHERDQACIKCVGTVRVREIMRPPTNQSIRRHLSDCSLTLGCPVPPSLLVARTICHPPLLVDHGTARLPEADRCRTPTRDRVFDVY